MVLSHHSASDTEIPGPTSSEVSEIVLRDDEALTYVSRPIRLLASLVESTYGPKSLDTLIRTEDHQGEPETVVSNDAGTILNAIDRGDGFEHPVARLVVDSIDSMQRGLPDGATTALLLTDGLVDAGIELIDQGVSAESVVLGYNVAAARTGAVLDELVRPVSAVDGGLETVARTALPTQLSAQERSNYAAATADAVERLRDGTGGNWLDTDDIKIDSSTAVEGDEFHEGIVVRQWPKGLEAVEQEYGREEEFDWEAQFPDPVADVGVAVIDQEVDFEETATPLGDNSYGGAAGVELDSAAALDSYSAGLASAIEAECDRLSGLGVDVFVAQPRIDDEIRHALADAGITLLDNVQTPESDVHRIARLTDAVVTSRLDDISVRHVGTADRVSQRRVGDEKWTSFERADGGSSTLVMRAKTDRGGAFRVDTMRDALDIVALAAMDDQLLPGACAGALTVSRNLRSFALKMDGKHQLSVRAFADALDRLASIFARNGGLDPIDTLGTAKQAHATESAVPESLGIDIETGQPMNAWEAGVVEPRRTFSQAVETAQTTAEQLLMTDSVYFADGTPH